jgi:alkanesulfonate monooxygenase SsuD/methylene tetrahydromethanopterin reductase-like flavin-dependent oxidoreductase (luciferase family)
MIAVNCHRCPAAAGVGAGRGLVRARLRGARIRVRGCDRATRELPLPPQRRIGVSPCSPCPGRSSLPGGERKTLRLVAQYADRCHIFGTRDEVAHKVDVLRRHCGVVGRNPSEIERTANVGAQTARTVQEWLKVGLQHFVVRLAYPFETKDLELELEWDLRISRKPRSGAHPHNADAHLWEVARH